MRVRAMMDCYVEDVWHPMGDEYDVHSSTPLGDAKTKVMIRLDDSAVVDPPRPLELPIFPLIVPQPQIGKYEQMMNNQRVKQEREAAAAAQRMAQIPGGQVIPSYQPVTALEPPPKGKPTGDKRVIG